MANPQIDQFMQALIWKAVLPIILFGGAAILLREFLRWLGRKATGGRDQLRRRETARTGESRRSQIDSRFPIAQPDGLGLCRTAPAASIAATGPRSPAQKRVPQLTLEDITWENFELLAGEIFRRKGFEVEISSGLGADGGKDLTLRRDGELRLVQCKLLSTENKVSVMAMREFYGLLMAENAKSGIFMTTGLYSRDAREFAEGKPIKLLGRADIQKLMVAVALPGENLCNVRNWIDDFTAAARVTDPNCPRCRHPMKLRRGPTGRAFWGCSFFPRCRGKRNARTELVRAFSYQKS